MKIFAESNRYGFSLIEVNLAVLLISVGLLSLFALFPLGLKESERGLADTQESMLADTILSSMEGHALSITNWDVWCDNDAFYGAVTAGITVQGIENGGTGDASSVPFPQGSTYEIRYSVSISDLNGSGHKRAKLNVKHGRYGKFGHATTYYTDFIYLGM